MCLWMNIKIQLSSGAKSFQNWHLLLVIFVLVGDENQALYRFGVPLW